MQTIFEKCPFKENGKLSKFFRQVLRGLNLPAGSDTPQNKILWCIRPCWTRPCGVSDPAEQDPVGNQTPRTMAELCTFYSIHLFCGVSDHAEQSPAWYQTPRNNIQNKYFCEFEKEFKNILGCEFGDYMGSIRGKNQRSKISCYCPLIIYH
jgi:hypothetical protein